MPTSRFRFPHSLQPTGSGSGKPIKIRDRKAIKQRDRAHYHVFIQAAVVCQGLLQYLAVAFPQRGWDAFGSWLRTIRPGIPPSEFVVAKALRQSLPEFLLNAASGNIFAKFVSERQDTDKMQPFRLAS